MSNETEQRILDAAKKVFLQKGMDGARMQEIANVAGINKASLHYYFRSKDKLFDSIIKEVFNPFVNTAFQSIHETDDLLIAVRKIASGYIDIFVQNPYLPWFIFNEINRDPDTMIKRFVSSGMNPALFIPALIKKLKENGIVKVHPAHLIINMISLSAFPFIAKPAIERFFLAKEGIGFKEFMEERKDIIIETLVAYIEKQKSKK